MKEARTRFLIQPLNGMFVRDTAHATGKPIATLSSVEQIATFSDITIAARNMLRVNNDA